MESALVRIIRVEVDGNGTAGEMRGELGENGVAKGGAVAAGLGSAICIDGVIPAVFSDRIVFRPFAPALKSDAYLAWRKDVPLTPGAAALVERVRSST